MTYWIRFRDWYLTRFRGARRGGKLVLLAAPLLFACCGLTMISALINPPDTEQPAEGADRAATVELAEVEPTDEPAPTDEPTAAPTTADEPTATARPTNTRPAQPTATSEPTEGPTSPPVRAATAVAATVAASQATTVAQPTAPPPTSTPPPAPTAAPTLAPPTAVPTQAPTAIPTQAPLPTATTPPVAAPGDVIISSVRYNGDVPQVESDEYAVITNRGAAVINIGGWRLNAGEPDQNFTFPSFDLQPGQSCRVYTNEVHSDTCGFTFSRGDAIWRNSGDCGALFDATGAEVSRFCW